MHICLYLGIFHPFVLTARLRSHVKIPLFRHKHLCTSTFKVLQLILPLVATCADIDQWLGPTLLKFLILLDVAANFLRGVMGPLGVSLIDLPRTPVPSSLHRSQFLLCLPAHGIDQPLNARMPLWNGTQASAPIVDYADISAPVSL